MSGSTPQPIIVGRIGPEGACNGGIGFRVEYVYGSYNILELDPAADREFSQANAVNDDGIGLVVGKDEDCPIGSPECQYFDENLVWDTDNEPPSHNAAINMLALGDPDWKAECKDVNIDGQIAAWGYLSVMNICDEHALFYASYASSPHDLNQYLATGHRSFANALRDEEVSGRVQVVGTDLVDSLAILFERISGSWNALELTNLIEDAMDCGTTGFRVAVDINSYGQILVRDSFVDEEEVTHVRSFILTDRTGCTADLTTSTTGCEDGQVNVHDLFLLLANWNTSGPGAELASPTNVVDVNDLFFLLGHWGFCNGEPGTLLETEEDCFEKFPLSEIEALISCLEAVHGIGE